MRSFKAFAKIKEVITQSCFSFQQLNGNKSIYSVILFITHHLRRSAAIKWWTTVEWHDERREMGTILWLLATRSDSGTVRRTQRTTHNKTYFTISQSIHDHSMYQQQLIRLQGSTPSVNMNRQRITGGQMEPAPVTNCRLFQYSLPCPHQPKMDRHTRPHRSKSLPLL